MKQRLRYWLGLDRLEQRQNKLLLAQARTLATIQREWCSIPTLAQAEYSIYSQWGEDGILDWLIEQFPNIPQSFVELGCGDYEECNTRLLMELRNWSGTVIDATPASIAHIRQQDYYWRHDLTAQCFHINKDALPHVPPDLGVLSIDLDGMDYWIWHSLTVMPWIVVCEYNAVFGFERAVTVPYREDFDRTQAHHSNLYFGASLPALRKLAGAKGYTFIGTESHGCNAFFVRNELAATLSIQHYTEAASKFREARTQEGQLFYPPAASRAALIAHLPLEEV